MTTEERLAEVRRQKNEAYEKLDAILKEEYQLEHEHELAEAENAVGKYYKKKKAGMGEEEIFHVQSVRRGKNEGDLVRVCGEGLSYSSFLIGDVYLNCWNRQIIEVGEFLEEWMQIPEKEYLETKRWMINTFLKDIVVDANES